MKALDRIDVPAKLSGLATLMAYAAVVGGVSLLYLILFESVTLNTTATPARGWGGQDHITAAVSAIQQKVAAQVPLRDAAAEVAVRVPTPELPAAAEGEPEDAAVGTAEPEPATVPVGPAALVLKGTVRRDDRLLAIINGDIVGVGDEIETYRVETIRLKRVTLVDGEGNRKQLNLYEDL